MPDYQILRDPIKVIYNSNKSTKLIKGATYLATSIRTYINQHINTTYKNVTLKNIGTFNVENFISLDGRPLNEKGDFILTIGEKLNADVNYIGQFIKCIWDSGNILKNGEIYYVENQKRQAHVGYKGYISYSLKLKIRGIKNYVNDYHFEEIPIQKQRNLKLKNLNGVKIKTGDRTRKYLLYSEKERIAIIFELLTKVLIDINNSEITDKLDIVKLMLNKGKKYRLIEEDILPFLKTIKKILEPYNKVIDNSF